MSVTRDTSHFEMSPLKNDAEENMRLMSVTRDTSHASIGPCGPFKHSPFGDSLRHVSTALLSCTMDCGENAGVGAGGAVGLSREIERKSDSVRSRFMRDRVRMTFMLKMCICARTAARIWRNADKEHTEQDPKMRRQTNLRVLMNCFALSLHPHACVLLAPCRESENVCVNYV